ncbi:MAG: glycosyltransferase [Bacteroidota bacterium]
MNRIKILITTSNFHTAGSGKVIFDLINGLDKSKFEVEIASGNDKGNFFKTVEALGLPIHILDTKTSYRPHLTLIFRILRISKFLKQHQYDIVHSWQWSSDWSESVASKLAGAKWIYTKKAMGFKSRHWAIKSWLADFIITINDEMKFYFPRKKAQRLIPLGIDITHYNPYNFDKKQRTQTFKIITIANLVPVKGIEILIKAIKIIPDSAVALTVVGDASLEYGIFLKELVQNLNLTHCITFIGKKSDIRPYLANSDVYVIPTLDEGRKEGMPMALVEAMSMGMPVLGSDISGINFVLRDFKQLLFKAGDEEALSSKLMYIKGLSVKERDDLGKLLRTYCINHFSLKSFIENHENLYEELAKKKI